jgi:ATP-dependent Clp protease ATP-binding subunit ClpA
MEWTKICVLTTTQAADLISEILMEAGSSGTMIEDKNDVYANQRPEGQWDIIDEAIAERIGDDVKVTGYYPNDENLPGALAQVRAAMETRFKPEFMGRIGDNVVLFDYIDGAPAQAILSKQVRQVNTRVESLHGVRVEVGQDCWDLLFARALEPGYREKGGRGIGNLVEDVYLNALSDFLFDLRGRDGARVVAHAAGSGVRFEVVGA